MRRRIKKVREINFLSLVPTGANWFPVLYKEAPEGSQNLEINLLTKGEITDEGLLTALVYAPEVRDRQGDVASAEIVRDMAHAFAKAGLNLDIRHDEKPVGRDKAFVAESFIVAKGDPRFAGWKDLDGNAVDAEGGWGVVLKIEDENLRKLYREKKWNGVSMGGRAEFEIEKGAERPQETILMDEKALKLMFENLQKSIVEAITSANKPPEKPKAEEKVVAKIDLTSIKDVQKRLADLRKEKLAQEIDVNNPESLEAHLELLKQMQDDAEKSETVEERAARLAKELAASKARISKLEKASKLPPGTPEDSDEDDDDLAKDSPDPRKLAALINAERGFGEK